MNEESTRRGQQNNVYPSQDPALPCIKQLADGRHRRQSRKHCKLFADLLSLTGSAPVLKLMQHAPVKIGSYDSIVS